MKSSALSPHGSLGCLLHFLEMLGSTLKYQAYLYIGGNLYPTAYVLWVSVAMVVGLLQQNLVLNMSLIDFFQKQSQWM